MTVDVSKQVSYAVLATKDVAVSKQNAYAVLRTNDVAVSKQNAYAVLAPGQVQVSKQVAYAVLLRPGTLQRRLAYIGAEPIVGGVPNARLSFLQAEPITGGNPAARLSYILAEPVTGGSSTVRCALIGIEIFYGLPKEKQVATDVFPSRIAYSAPLVYPGLPGLRWSRTKKPEFRTKTESAVAGRELRTSRMPYPIWNFELEFEFLRGNGEEEIERLMGFFLTQKGSFQEWLFHDWDDYQVTGQTLGEADGGTTGFPLMRTLGGFIEPIGQVDNAQLFTFTTMDVDVMTNSITVDDHGMSTGYGPIQLTATAGTLPDGLDLLTNYWIISNGTNSIKLATSAANAIANMPVSINDAGMTGPFLASNSIAVYVAGVEIDPADYVVNVNEIVFDTAPTMGTITWTGKYYFVCNFLDDMAEFEEFMDKLWSLDTIAFKSIPGLITQ